MIAIKFTARHTAALTLAAVLGGCGTTQIAYRGDGGYGVAAASLDQALLDRAAKPDDNDKNQGLHLVAQLVQDSQTKCDSFIKRLVVSETGINTGLDLATTALSALGTAFTPLATVHALSAASSIASGSRTAIDSDIYAKASIANFAQAIQSTYYQDMKTYWSATSKLGSADAQIELPVILQIHAECALAPAEASISSTLKGSDNNDTTAADAAGKKSLMPVPGHAVK